MISVIPFTAEHAEAVILQIAQQADCADGAPRRALALAYAAQEHCWSFVGERGQVLACFGLIMAHDQHYTAWALLSALDLPALLFATRWCRNYLAGIDARRIDCTVRCDFDNGHSWARLLGFAPEGIQQAFYPDGGDMMVYARIKGSAI